MSFFARKQKFHPVVFWTAVVSLGWSFGLLYAGAFTTSIGAGMAFLDWPLSNSSLMPEGWWDQMDQRAEHGHRLMGAKLGLLAIVLVVLTQVFEARRGVRRLAWIFLLAVIAQGILGGLRVLFDYLNTGAANNSVAYVFRVLHACGAQITVALLATLVLVTSRAWWATEAQRPERARRSAEAKTETQRRSLGWLEKISLVAVAVIFVQILFGALMRHAGAGLAIQTYPLTPQGGLFPEIWSAPVAFHWIHRWLAVPLLGIVLAQAWLAWKAGGGLRRGLAAFSTCIVFMQFLLGVATILSFKNSAIASLHMVVGAALFLAVWTQTLWSFRLRQVAQSLAVSETRDKRAPSGWSMPETSAQA